MARRGILGTAAPGLGRLAQAVAGNQGYQQGYDAELQNRSRLAQAVAQARHLNAQADQNDLETEQLRGRPQAVHESVALGTGTDMPRVNAVLQAMRTGVMPTQPGTPAGPPMEDGTAPAALPMVDEETRGRIATQLSRLLPVLTAAKDINPEQLAKANALYREGDLSDAVIRGDLAPAAVGRGQAAVAAKPLFNSDATGAVLDLFGGRLDTDNPMAKSSIGLKTEQAGAARANAAESYAGVGLKKAQTVNEQAEGGGGSGGRGKLSAGYRWSADGKTQEPIPGGPADPNTKGAKLSKPPTEGQAKALMFGSRMAVADEVLGELERGGESQPGRIKQAVETFPGVGGALGMGVNSLPTSMGGPSDMQQQVEQAQRDFINAVLRRESGAAIADSEFRNAQRQYFPQPGDSPGVRRQKAANRQTAIAGFKAEFGEPSMPQFQEIVSTARKTRRAPTAPEASWEPGKPAQAPGQPAGRNIVVDF
jgi:hypothetical protein